MDKKMTRRTQELYKLCFEIKPRKTKITTAFEATACSSTYVTNKIVIITFSREEVWQIQVCTKVKSAGPPDS